MKDPYEIPNWLCGPLLVFTGPLALVFVLGFVLGHLTIKR